MGPRKVAQTQFNETLVSTVNLGDFAVSRFAYETCVFYPDGESEVLERYATELESKTGHRAWCELLLDNNCFYLQ